MMLAIRPYEDRDRSVTPSLGVPGGDPIWQDQFHILHGPERDLPFRRTLVALQPETGRVVGMATLAARPLHPTRDACAIEVHPDHRRSGIATALIGALREQFPQRFPVMTKVPATDVAAIGFLASCHATMYQVVPAFTLRPTKPVPIHPNIAGAGVTITSLDEVPGECLIQAFASMYAWTHEGWNPVSSLADLRRAADHEVADADHALSSIAWADGEPYVIVLAFPDDDGNADIAAECVRRDVPSGHAMLMATLRRTIERAHAAGIRHLNVDGHVSDPHLFPALHRIADRDVSGDLIFFEIPVE